MNESTSIITFFEMSTGASIENLLLVIAGFFWCFFGIILRKLYKSSKEGKTLVEFFKETPNKELIFKGMLVIAAMRFFRVIFDTDEIAFAGFVIGLSLDILPDIIFAIPKVFTSRFTSIVDIDRKADSAKSPESDNFSNVTDAPDLSSFHEINSSEITDNHLTTDNKK